MFCLFVCLFGWLVFFSKTVLEYLFSNFISKNVNAFMLDLIEKLIRVLSGFSNHGKIFGTK